MNVTLSVDARVLTEARRIATVRGTTLNQIIRDHLQELTRIDDIEAAVGQLDRLWSTSTGRSRHAWTREELHGRP